MMIFSLSVNLIFLSLSRFFFLTLIRQTKYTEMSFYLFPISAYIFYLEGKKKVEIIYFSVI